MLQRAERGESFAPLERARYMRNKTYVAKLCVQAVNRLFDAGGGRRHYGAFGVASVSIAMRTPPRITRASIGTPRRRISAGRPWG